MSFNEWKKNRLDEFAELVKKQYLPNTDNEYIYIGLEHIEQQTLRLNGAGNSKNVVSQKNKFCSGDILFGKLRPYFRKVYRPNFDGVCSTDIWVIRAKKDFDQGFLFYFLANQSFIDASNSGSSGTRMPRADWGHLSKTEWKIPPISTQHRIADILSALDDKIEFNRQTNAILEAIAQAIFKEWFVDFNFPGATGEMVESELGMIPRGWRVGKLGEVVDVNMGQSPPGESYNQIGDGVIFFQGKAEYGFRFPVIDKFTSAPKKFAKKFDTLLSVRAPVGTINMARERCCIGRGLAAISGKNDAWSFTFYCLKNLEEHFKIYEGTGTVFGSINKTEIENIDIVVSPTEVIYSFERVVNQIDELILNTDDESTTLSTIRDTLLPKMMSGEIEV